MGRAQLQELEERGHYYSAPRGVSMLPMIRGGRDVVEVRRLDHMAQRGEVVLYVRGPNEQGVLHRVIHVRERDYVIAGDNCWQREIVPHERVVGVVVTFCRNGMWYSVSHVGYRLYSRVWTALFPLRRSVCFARDKIHARVLKGRRRHR